MTVQPIIPPSFGVGGYSDDIYNFGTYGTSRRRDWENVQVDHQVPSAYSLDMGFLAANSTQ